MQPDLHSRALAAHTLHQFRILSPLTHCMTNEVVQSFTANTLLALGASPAMVIEPEEASQFAAIASALLVNVGTLTRERATAMRAAVEQAHHAKTPWTLDPVAVGARVSPPLLHGIIVTTACGYSWQRFGNTCSDRHERWGTRRGYNRYGCRCASGSAGAGSSDWDHCRGYRRSGLRHRWSAYRLRGRW